MISRSFIADGLLDWTSDDIDSHLNGRKSNVSGDTPLFLPDTYGNIDVGSDSDMESALLYICLLSYADRHKIGEWFRRLGQ